MGNVNGWKKKKNKCLQAVSLHFLILDSVLSWITVKGKSLCSDPRASHRCLPHTRAQTSTCGFAGRCDIQAADNSRKEQNCHMKVAVTPHVLCFPSAPRARQRLSKRLEVDYRGKMPSKMKVPEGTCVPFCPFWQLQSEGGWCVSAGQRDARLAGSVQRWSKIKARTIWWEDWPALFYFYFIFFIIFVAVLKQRTEEIKIAFVENDASSTAQPTAKVTAADLQSWSGCRRSMLLPSQFYYFQHV